MRRFLQGISLRLLATSCAHTHSGLEAIIDPPLEASKCTNHENTRAETFCCKSSPSDLLNNRPEAPALVRGLAKLGDK